MRKITGAILLGLVLCVASADGAIIFQDDFENGSGQWTLSGTAAVANGVLDGSATMTSDPWVSVAYTNQQFTASGTYTLKFDSNGNAYPGGTPTSLNMPGGLQIKYGIYNNGDAIAYKESVLATVNICPLPPTSWAAWRTVTMIADYDALTAEVLVNFGSGDVSVWSGTLPSAPDFVSYDRIVSIASATTYFNSYDNMTLDYVPEPATMTLMGIGGVFALLRRRK